jgi:hypothetical protein
MRGQLVGSSTCSLCNATYRSDNELREHQRMSHRGRGNEEKIEAAAVAEQAEEHQA